MGWADRCDTPNDEYLTQCGDGLLRGGLLARKVLVLGLIKVQLGQLGLRASGQSTMRRLSIRDKTCYL